MQHGPNLVYKCPTCGNLTSKGSLTSGNTFGATLFSDGKMYAPHQPEFPYLVKCPKCKKYCWLNDDNFLGREALPGDANTIKEYDDIPIERSTFLSWEEYIEASNSLTFDAIHDEIYLRLRIWWGFNRRSESDSLFYDSENGKLIWLENINRLLALFDPADVYQRIYIAELNRHLGNFELCMEIINSLDDSLQWEKYKRHFRDECDKKNTKVFVIHSNFLSK